MVLINATRNFRKQTKQRFVTFLKSDLKTDLLFAVNSDNNFYVFDQKAKYPFSLMATKPVFGRSHKKQLDSLIENNFKLCLTKSAQNFDHYSLIIFSKFRHKNFYSSHLITIFDLKITENNNNGTPKKKIFLKRTTEKNLENDFYAIKSIKFTEKQIFVLSMSENREETLNFCTLDKILEHAKIKWTRIRTKKGITLPKKELLTQKNRTKQILVKKFLENFLKECAIFMPKAVLQLKINFAVRNLDIEIFNFRKIGIPKYIDFEKLCRFVSSVIELKQKPFFDEAKFAFDVFDEAKYPFNPNSKNRKNGDFGSIWIYGSNGLTQITENDWNGVFFGNNKLSKNGENEIEFSRTKSSNEFLRLFSETDFDGKTNNSAILQKMLQKILQKALKCPKVFVDFVQKMKKYCTIFPNFGGKLDCEDKLNLRAKKDFFKFKLFVFSRLKRLLKAVFDDKKVLF
ncbi:hypothetical protein MHBO_002416 [Bonamia ostreae]|uniref:Uncharacterized protein n=1 Tax=Bonamia ostreae TaxID=126728 RepID=A0ABV2AM81_9EUKA